MFRVSRHARIPLISSAAVIAGLIPFAAGPAQVATTTATAGVLQRANPHASLPLHGSTVDSLNWAGYAVTPASGFLPDSPITGVLGTFAVPSAGLLPPGFGATWAGIGGYDSSDLIQAGVAEQSLPSNPLLGNQYYAWYELLPDAETQITGCTGDANCTVNPGDEVQVDIHNVSGNNWSISISDEGHWTFSKTVTYTSSESSAEWIQEAPSLSGLQTLPAPVGNVAFGPGDVVTTGGSPWALSAGDPTLINESPGLLNEATTSPIGADHESFDVCVYAQTCAAPVSG